MPLKSGSSKETIQQNIKEMLDSPTFAPDKPQEVRIKMAVAAAHRKAGVPRHSTN
jgi:hypothetical protein